MQAEMTRGLCSNSYHDWSQVTTKATIKVFTSLKAIYRASSVLGTLPCDVFVHYHEFQFLVGHCSEAMPAGMVVHVYSVNE